MRHPKDICPDWQLIRGVMRTGQMRVSKRDYLDSEKQHVSGCEFCRKE